MKEELDAWNNGRGIELEDWVSCEGSFSLAVGYAELFCPIFVEFEDYIFRGDDFGTQDIERLRAFERQRGSNAKSIEWVMNHIHIADLHHNGCDDIALDKILILGEMLQETYRARLAYFFPDKPCVVEFHCPHDELDFDEYQLSFWQKKHEYQN